MTLKVCALEPQAGQMLSHYQLLERIGQGGMGVVWKARDSILDRTVAIKLLPAHTISDEKLQSRFLEEARLASSLSDAHIAQVYELGRDGTSHYIVMEFVIGGPLGRLIGGRPLPPGKVAVLGLQVARALARAHRRGLIHRDLKPANILVTPDGDVKVVDFGLATLFDDSATNARLDGPTLVERDPAAESLTPRATTQRGELEGTPAYMSPEQTRGEAVDQHSDIFSLGVVLYEMTTGQLPFRGETVLEILQRIRAARPVPAHDLVPGIPLDLDRIIQKAMASNPADRYQTMDDLAVDLRRLAREIESGTAPSYHDLTPPAVPKRRRRTVAWIAAGAALAALAAVAALTLLIPPRRSAIDMTLLILPMDVSGQAEGADYAGRAFAEAVAINLAQLKELSVLPVPASGLPSGSDALAPARAALDVGAAKVIVGSLVRAGGEVQASLSLVDAVRNRIVWGVQRKAADDSMASLAAQLSRELSARLGTSRPRQYDYFKYSASSAALAASPLLSEALGAIRRYDLPAALDAGKRLVEAFPREAEAHVLMAYALGLEAFETTPSSPQRAMFEGSLASIERLDPHNPWPQVFRAGFLARDGRHKESGRLVSEVLLREELTPAARAYILGRRASAESQLSNHSAALGDLEEALRLDPANDVIFRAFAEVMLNLERHEDALTRARQAVALNPTSSQGHGLVGEALFRLRRWDESSAALGRACELDNTQTSCGFHAAALAMAGRHERAREAADRAARLPESDAGSYNLACYKAFVGQRAEALGLLERSLELGAIDPTQVERDEMLASLREDPAFRAILAVAARRFGER